MDSFCTEFKLNDKLNLTCTYCVLDLDKNIKAVSAFVFEQSNFRKLGVYSYSCDLHRETAMLNITAYDIVSNSFFLKKIRHQFNKTNLWPENMNFISTIINKNLFDIINSISLNSKLIKE